MWCALLPVSIVTLTIVALSPSRFHGFSHKQANLWGGRKRTIIILLQFPSHKWNRQNNTLLGAFWCWVELRTSTLDKEDEVICGGIQEENHNCLVVFRTIPWFKTQMTPLHRVFHKIQKSNYIEECFILSKGFKIFQPQLWHRAFSVVEIVDDFLWGNKNTLLHCSLQLLCLQIQPASNILVIIDMTAGSQSTNVWCGQDPQIPWLRFWDCHQRESSVLTNFWWWPELCCCNRKFVLWWP